MTIPAALVLSVTFDLLDAAYQEMLASGRRGQRGAAEPMSARSVEVVHKAVKAAYALAVDRGQLVRNPAALATAPTVREQIRRWWTPEQVGAFLRYVGQHGAGSLPTGLVDVLVDTGGRRGEALALRWVRP